VLGPESLLLPVHSRFALHDNFHVIHICPHNGQDYYYDNVSAGDIYHANDKSISYKHKHSPVVNLNWLRNPSGPGSRVPPLPSEFKWNCCSRSGGDRQPVHYLGHDSAERRSTALPQHRKRDDFLSLAHVWVGRNFQWLGIGGRHDHHGAKQQLRAPAEFRHVSDIEHVLAGVAPAWKRRSAGHMRELHVAPSAVPVLKCMRNHKNDGFLLYTTMIDRSIRRALEEASQWAGKPKKRDLQDHTRSPSRIQSGLSSLLRRIVRLAQLWQP